MEFLFGKAYEAYQSDNERFWKLFNLMTLVNGGLLAIVCYCDKEFIWLAASVFGAFLCLVWSGMQFRYGWWCRWWDDKLKEIEGKYTSSAHITVEVFQAHSNEKVPLLFCRSNGRLIVTGFSTRKTTGVLPIGLAMMWLAVLVYSITQLAQ